MKKARTRFSRVDQYNTSQRVESNILSRIDRAAKAISEGMGIKTASFGCKKFSEPRRNSAHNLQLVR